MLGRPNSFRFCQLATPEFTVAVWPVTRAADASARVRPAVELMAAVTTRLESAVTTFS